MSVKILHARGTNTLLICEKTIGESNLGLIPYNLVDESGNRYIDESGNYYITYDYERLQTLHAKETNTLLQCEET